MDIAFLTELLTQVKEQGGGIVLQIGGKSEAVILSIDRYNALLASPVPEAINSPTKALKTVLVIGGAGRVGSLIAKELLAKGYKVVILDDLSTGNLEAIPKEALFFEGDYNNPEVLDAIFQHNKIADVVYALGYELYSASIGFENIITQIPKFLGILASYGVNRFVCYTSTDIYAHSSSTINENSAISPYTNAGHASRILENLFDYYSKTLNISVTVFRSPTIFTNSFTLGPEAETIALLFSVLNGQEPAYQLYGNDFPTNDGTRVIELIHANDLSSAFVLALQQENAPLLQIYNLSSGKSVSIQELITIATEITGHMVPIDVLPKRLGQVVYQSLDINKIKTELGYKPSHQASNLFEK